MQALTVTALPAADDFDAPFGECPAVRDALVAVVPGSGFGTPGYVRLSYATSLSIIERGIERIVEAVGRLS